MPGGSSTLYRCALCDSIVPPNTSARSVVTEVRRRTYPVRERSIPPAGKSGKRRRWRDDPGGSGWEAARIEICLLYTSDAADE